MSDSNAPATPEPELGLTHVHHTDTGLTAPHATLTALADWIGQEVDRYNDHAEAAEGEAKEIENPLRHLVVDDRTQMVQPAGRIELVELLYAMSRDETAGPDGAGDSETGPLRRLAGELATTIRTLHHVREDDYILFVLE